MTRIDGAAGPGVEPDDVRLLHASLLEAERRAAMLTDVIEALSLSPDATILAQRAVELVARACDAHGAFVYLWDADRDALVLRAATEGRQQQFVDGLTLRLGEGITGWSALMRRPAIINDDLLDDPRFVHFPQAAEVEFQSALVVPILIPGGDAVGVFSLYSTRSHAFDERMAEWVGEVAKLLASGIDRTAQFEVRTRQSKALHALVGLAKSPPRTMSSALAAVAERCLTIIPSSLCVVEVADSYTNGDDVVGVSIARAEQRRLPAHVLDGGTADSATIHTLLHEWEPRLESISQPIHVSGRLIGTVVCHRPSRFAGDDRLLLEAVANYAALVLAGTTTAGPSPFDELVRSRNPALAEQLLVEFGWVPKSLVTPFVVLLDPLQELPRSQALTASTRVVEAAVKSRVRRLLPDEPGTVAGLVLGAVIEPAEQGELQAEFARALLDSGHQTRLEVGWGGPSAAAPGIIEGLRAAREAALWATLVRSPQGVLSHKNVQLLRSMAGVVQDRQADLAQARADIARVEQYDHDTGSALLETLRAHVEYQGSAADAAKSLYIHRNTLRQRLDKLERMLSIPLDSTDGWFVTRLALLIRDREADAKQD